MAELLEREDLLAQLGALRVDGGRLVFVGGEAGVGKTVLVREFTARVAGRVLQGSCENLTTPTPYGPFLDVGVPTEGEPRHVAAALLRGLERTRLLVLEDVHWADEATLDVLRVLGRRIESTDALVLATYRDDEIDGSHPLRVVLGELTSAPAVSRLSVPRLSLGAIGELAEPHGADVEAIHRLTQGNAFYVTEILAAGDGVLPETVRDAVLARAARLAPDARLLLDAVSVVPARAELWLLEEVAAAELEHLDACIASGVLRADGDAVAFRHELARLAIESALKPHRRRYLNAAILAALRPAGDYSRLAHHAAAAGDSAAVVEYATEAGRQAAAASSHREAAAQYASALRHADGIEASARAALLDAYAEEAHVTGLYAEAVEARRAALDLYHALDDPLREGYTLSRLTIAYIRLGRNAEAEEASRGAIRLLETLPPGRELACAYADQAYARMLSRDNAEGVAWGEKAVAAAAALGDSTILAYGLNMIGTSYVMSGEIDRGVEYLLQSLDVARSEELEVWVVSALGMLGSGLGEMVELELSERFLRECITFSEDHEITPSYSQAWLALVQVYRGRWEEGARLASAVLARTPDPISRISALIALGRLRARRGDPGALDALDEALESARPGGHLQRLGHVHAARAEAAWLAGDATRTVQEAATAYPLALEKRHLWFAGELAYWQWKAGALDDAPEWIAEPYRLQLAGDAAGAAAAWRNRLCPYEAARSLADAGDEGALAELDALRARPAAAALRRRLGLRGPRDSTRGNPAGLTARELDVLRLVAAGKRNADVADELVVSPRTVDHHVSAILRKLRVRTRGEAAVAAAELGLLQDR